jgi:membrane protein DedA with SNARE-associated domain
LPAAEIAGVVAVHHVEAWLGTLPPETIYLIVGLVIGLESMGIPLPGEVTLVSASLLASTGLTSPWGVASAAAAGAILGDSVGYAVGRRGGRALLIRLGRRFPGHMGPDHLARAERIFARWGVWAVFFGRFVALLRILAGPLAGALHVPYRKFLVANATGGVVWAFGTTFLLYFLGRAAERWLKDLSWAALVVAVACGIATTLWLKRRARHAAGADDVMADDAMAADDAGASPAPAAARATGDRR